MLQLSGKKNVADNVAVINATDLSPIIENTQIKEIREVLAPATDPKTSRPVEISIKVAELSTTSPIEVNIVKVPIRLCTFSYVWEWWEVPPSSLPNKSIFLFLSLTPSWLSYSFWDCPSSISLDSMIDRYMIEMIHCNNEVYPILDNF